MTALPTRLERLFEILGTAGYESTAEEVAEMLWLAARLPVHPGEGLATQPTMPAAVPPAIPPALARESLPPSRGETFGPTVTATSDSAPGRPTTGLYPAQAGTGAGGTAARAIRSPGALALPGSLELGRSLRPLKRRVPSRGHVVLDEAATAHRIADTGDWTPVFRPAPERWLDLALVVEESSSMIIWQRTLAELQRLFERQGAFRTIEVLGFRASSGDRSIDIYTGIGPRAEWARPRRPAELFDPRGRRLIAVVSDCVSPVWHNGVMATLLSDWGQTGVAAIAQVLPDRLWVRTGLRTYPAVFVRSPAPGAPNSTFEIEWTNYRPRSGAPGGTAVPVVSLEAQSLDHWARAIAGNSNLWIPGVFAIPEGPVQGQAGAPPSTPPRPGAALPPEQLVRLFYGTASPTARRLASFLAAVPLTLPVMRLVQRALLPESRQVHLAEVWLSGLIDRPTEVDRAKPADDVEYFFVNGVRELLRNNLRLGEVIDVLTAVSGYMGEHVGQPLDFGALIADPQASGDVQITQGYQSFARVAASTLRRFGGQYADLAQRLEVGVYGETVPLVEPVAQVRVERPTQRPTRQATPSKGTVRVRALLVGSNEISSSGIYPLQGAGNDVRLARSWLQDKFGVMEADITMLLDRQATKQAIVDAWRKFASQIEAGDQLFFHFSGRDQAIASNDPNEADGLEETLVVYDSVPGDRATLLTHQELADLAAEVERRGGTSILLLDSCRTASGFLTRRALRDTLVFAGAAEAEESYETPIDGKPYGAVSYALAEAMRSYRQGMTWLDAYDHVLAQVRAMGFKQTPQLIGAGDLAIFGSERRGVLPHLLVTKVHEREIEVLVPSALGLGTGERGARLAIYPPGSAMVEPPIGVARVKYLTESGVAAALESPVTVSVASRVRVLEHGDDRTVISVGVPDDLRERMGVSSLVAFERDGPEPVDFAVSIEHDTYAIHDRERRVVWREPVAPEASLETNAERIRSLVEHVANYLRSMARENIDIRSELTGKVDLELVTTLADDVVPLAEAEPLMLRLRNRTTADLYVSVWMLDEFLGVERIFPATTNCVLLGKGREVTLAVAVQPDGAGDRPIPMTFKAFASTEPADLGVLSLPRLSQPFELGRSPTSAETELRPTPLPRQAAAAGSAAQQTDTVVPGGPVAVTAKLWKTGMDLRLKFLAGDEALQKRVIEAATEWTDFANLQFKVVGTGDAELRVGFEQGGSWSYLGTDSLTIPADQPTINLGLLTPTTDRSELRRVVLHEFGHALGLAASQQSPIAAIPWNKKATYKYYAKIGWSRQDVDANIFARYPRGQVTYGPADPYSVMYDPISVETTDGKVAIVPGIELSAGDKRFIADLYPAATHRDWGDVSEIQPHSQWTTAQLAVTVRFVPPTLETAPEGEVVLLYGATRAEPFPSRMRATPPSGRRVNVRSRPDRLLSKDIVNRIRDGALFTAYQVTGTGAMAPGSASRVWYGNRRGSEWIHSSGLRRAAREREGAADHGGQDSAEPDPTAGVAREYLDFEIEVSAAEVGGYNVRVLRSPAGEATSAMRLPFTELERQNNLQALQIALLRSGAIRRGLDTPESKAVAAFGQQLWRALFQGGVLERFQATRSMARSKDAGVRIKLRFETPELSALPWEYLFDADGGDYVTLSDSTSIVRYLSMPQLIKPLRVQPPLRILGMVVNAADRPAIDVERESSRLDMALADLTRRRLVELVWTPGGTLRDLQQVLRSGPWHAFHLIGHYGFNESRGEGMVVFRDDAGKAQLVSATDLGRLLGDHDPLRLAVLNAYESTRGDQLDVFSSSAATLVRRGTAAVVGMQYEITDAAAVEFSRSFFEAVASGIPVDTAVTEARQRVALAIPGTLEWGTPVLYMRVPDGALFDMLAPPP